MKSISDVELLILIQSLEALQKSRSLNQEATLSALYELRDVRIEKNGKESWEKNTTWK